MRRRYKKPQHQQQYFRTNHTIRARELRVIDDQGEFVGVLPLQEALTRAVEAGLDLVEVAPNADPPVAKIIDLNKFLYQQSKKKREQKPTKTGEAKEVWLRPFIAEHDLASRAERGKELLEEAGKLKIVVKFKRAELRKRDFGYSTLNKFIRMVGVSEPDKPPKFLGQQLIATISKK